MAALIKIENNWKEASNIYVKENGAWNEIDVNNLSQYASQNVFLYGGYEESGPEHSGGQYDPSSPQEPNTDIIYDNEPGKPNVKTDENGKVTEYTFTDTGVTVSDVDTGVIAFDSNNPGFTIHLVAEFIPSASTETKAIISANNGGSSQGLTIYSSGNYMYAKIKTQAYDTGGSKFKAWSYFSPTGKDNNYYKNRNEVTFDLIFTSDKKFTLIINGKSTDYENYSFAPDFDNISIKIGTGIPDFTINELTVTKS